MSFVEDAQAKPVEVQQESEASSIEERDPYDEETFVSDLLASQRTGITIITVPRSQAKSKVLEVTFIEGRDPFEEEWFYTNLLGAAPRDDFTVTATPEAQDPGMVIETKPNYKTKHRGKLNYVAPEISPRWSTMTGAGTGNYCNAETVWRGKRAATLPVDEPTLVD